MKQKIHRSKSDALLAINDCNESLSKSGRRAVIESERICDSKIGVIVVWVTNADGTIPHDDDYRTFLYYRIYF